MFKQKLIFIFISLIIILYSFYSLFYSDLTNKKTILKVLVSDQKDESFLKALKENFSSKHPDILIKFYNYDYYEAARKISESSDYDLWFCGDESNIDYLEKISKWSEKNKNPIQEVFVYAYSPMVILGWQDKLENLGDFNFNNLYDAVANKKSWGQLNGENVWGQFKFGHTSPFQYNTGSRFIILLVNNFYSQANNSKKFITKQDMLKAKDYVRHFEDNVVKTLTDQDFVIEEMLYEDEPQFDFCVLDEYTILKNIQNANTIWSNLRIAYPNPNIYNNMPLVILNTSNPTSQKANAIIKLKEFVLSDEIQRKVFNWGFRPVNLNFPDLDLLEDKYSEFGFMKNVPPSLPYYGEETYDSIYKLLE